MLPLSNSRQPSSQRLHLQSHLPMSLRPPLSRWLPKFRNRLLPQPRLRPWLNLLRQPPLLSRWPSQSSPPRQRLRYRAKLPNRKLRPRQQRNRHNAPRATRRLQRPRQRSPRAAWLCRRLDLVRFIRRHRSSRSLPLPMADPPQAAFSAAGRSSIADPVAVPAAILSAPREALAERRVNSQAVRAPSTQLALRLAVLPDLVVPAHREHALALALVLALARVLAARLAPVLAWRLRPVRLRVPLALRQEDAADARSTPRLKKAQ